MARTVYVCLYVEAVALFLRKDYCDYQLCGGVQREQGFFFSQLGQLKASTRALYADGWRSRQAKDATWGERGEYGRAGRFAEKGGQQVGSAFQCTTHNEKIKAIYGNYGFWSWLRYWYLDSADYVTLMLMDKGFYDYDYSEPKPRKPKRPIDTTLMSDDEVAAILSTAVIPGTDTLVHKQPLSPSELQAEVMAEEKKKGAAQ